MYIFRVVSFSLKRINNELKTCYNLLDTTDKFLSTRREVFFKKVLLNILKNSQESTCARVPFQFSCRAEGLQR